MRWLMIFALTIYAGEGQYFLNHLPGTTFFIRINTKIFPFNSSDLFEMTSGYRINWDIRSFELENRLGQTKFDYHKHVFHRMTEKALNERGFDGQSCLFRAFCDLLKIQRRRDIVSRLLKVIFRTQDPFTCPKTSNCSLPLVDYAYVLYDKYSNFIVN